MSLNVKQVQPDVLYDCAYKPGLDEPRWGTRWRDGVARNVPGQIVLTNLVGTVSPLHVFPAGTDLRWDRGRPVEVKPVPPPPAEPTVSRRRKRKANKADKVKPSGTDSAS
jgi:hypothetical protein